MLYSERMSDKPLSKGNRAADDEAGKELFSFPATETQPGVSVLATSREEAEAKVAEIRSKQSTQK